MTKRPPTPRQEVYDLYWYFAAERQRIFEERIAGQPGPWTDDPILQTFKFCNTYRALDRVSQFMIRDVCYNTQPYTPDDRLFQIVAFRMFSNIETWQSVHTYLGHPPTLEDLASDAFTIAVEYAKQQNGKLYTGAFILAAANIYSQPNKHRNHVELFRHMFLEDQLGTKLIAATSLREIYDLLHTYPLMGDFMSYQIAIDLNYSDLINFDENDFTKAGPGALRGIQKCFQDFGDYTPEEIVLWMVGQQHSEFERLKLTFHGLFGRSLHAIDCQGLFCETDKYCRQALPELKSARQRIKTHFSESPDPINLFFPPKWLINR